MLLRYLKMNQSRLVLLEAAPRVQLSNTSLERFIVEYHNAIYVLAIILASGNGKMCI